MIEHPQFVDLFDAQLRATAAHCTLAITYLSDDGWDYLTSSIDLLHAMCEIRDTYLGQHDDDNRRMLLGLLQAEPYHEACDGVANEIWAWIESLGPDDDWYDELADDYQWETLPDVQREPVLRGGG